MKQLKCSSCKREITNIKGSTTFKCPACLKEDILRCGHCKSLGAKYTCACGAVGPN